MTMLLAIFLCFNSTIFAQENQGGYLSDETDSSAVSVVEDMQRTGGRFNSIDRQKECNASYSAMSEANEEYFNPLDNGDLPTLRNQANYNACWLFASLGAGEIQQFRQNKNIDLSELHLGYFAYNMVNNPQGGFEGDVNKLSDPNSDFLNKGGNLNIATRTLMGWLGAADEALAPYEGNSIRNVIENGLPEDVAYQDVLHLQSIYNLNYPSDKELIKSAVKQYGGASISFFSAGAADTYYSLKNNSYYCPFDISVNHAAIIVGWDDNFSKENFNNIPEHDGAWLVRNSFASDVADAKQYHYNTYFWLSYDDKSISESVYILDFEPSDNYDINYQYDGALASSTVSLNLQDSLTGTTRKSEVFTAANIFNIYSRDTAELLKAVSFNTSCVNFEYEISIYKNPRDASDPTSGDKIGVTTKGFRQMSGYQTVQLDTFVNLMPGDTFAVVVRIIKDTGADILAEANKTSGYYNSYASAKAGQSFYQNENELWVDLGETNNINFRIKAYTSISDKAIDIAEFDDVTANTIQWKKEGIDFVLKRHYMEGVSRNIDGVSRARFAVDEPMTRAMFVKVLYNISGCPSMTGLQQFSDVTASKWYGDAVEFACMNGLTTGYMDGSNRFGPDDYITREQAAVMLHRFADKYYDYEKMIEPDGYDILQNKYADADCISDWAREGLIWARMSGIITGREKESLYYAAPKDYATRAECAVMIKRFMEHYNN